jgi:hypothetical protein
VGFIPILSNVVRAVYRALEVKLYACFLDAVDDVLTYVLRQPRRTFYLPFIMDLHDCVASSREIEQAPRGLDKDRAGGL